MCFRVLIQTGQRDHIIHYGMLPCKSFTEEVNIPLMESTKSALNEIEGTFMNKRLAATNSSLCFVCSKIHQRVRQFTSWGVIYLLLTVRP